MVRSSLDPGGIRAPSNGRVAGTAQRNSGATRSSPAGLQVSIGTHTVRPTKLKPALDSQHIPFAHVYPGPVFADLLPFPDAGAFHGSEGQSSRFAALTAPLCVFVLRNSRPLAVPIVFGTFNRSTATAAEVELSHSLQTAFANFAKDPVDASPAPNWPSYHPGLPAVPSVAKIAYHGNVGLDDFVEPIQPNSIVSTRNLSSKHTHIHH